jgi:AraC-like DNA-binding protein
MDVLEDVLAVAGVRGSLGSLIAAGDDWGWWSAPTSAAAFLAVTSGALWVAVPGHRSRQLMAGDVMLLPGGSQYALASDPDALARTTEDAHDGWAWGDAGEVRIGSGATRTHVLCAHYEQDPTVSTQLLQVLPDLLHIQGEHGGGGLDDTIRLLARELANPELATKVVLNSLVDVLLVQVLREWLAAPAGTNQVSWLGALSDPVVGAALRMLHEDPARAWTNATLAREMSVSGATLSRRFRVALGATPAAYLTRWRMDVAAAALRDTGDPLEAVARSVGYTSVYAFSRAFSRARSQPPGRYRTMSRVDPSREASQ